MDSSERRIRLLYLLRRKEPSFAEHLAQQLGVSRRTIFRDLKILMQQGIPIGYDDNAGHYISSTLSIPPITLTERELMVFGLGLSFIAGQPDTTLRNEAWSIISKLQQSFSMDAASVLLGVVEQTQINPDSVQTMESSVSWPQLIQAILNKHKISFTYRKIDSLKKEPRHLIPEYLLFYGDHWTLQGYDIDREATRSFRVSNISDLKVDRDFIYTISPSAKYIREQPKKDYLIQILVRATHKYDVIRLKIPTKIVFEEDRKEGVEVHFPFPDLSYINRFLLQFGSDVSVLGPIELLAYRKIELDAMFSDFGNRALEKK